MTSTQFGQVRFNDGAFAFFGGFGHGNQRVGDTGQRRGDSNGGSVVLCDQLGGDGDPFGVFDGSAAEFMYQHEVPLT